MAIRNFWIEANIDGRNNELKGGPKSKEGGMEIEVFQRNEGEIVTALKVYCSELNGVLYANVFDGEGNLIFQYVTRR